MEEGGSNESCGSRVNENTTSPGSVLQGRQHPQRMQQKLEVYNEILRRLKETNHEEANLPGFDDQLWTHFNRLPARYVRVYVFISVSLRVCVCVCVFLSLVVCDLLLRLRYGNEKFEYFFRSKIKFEFLSFNLDC